MKASSRWYLRKGRTYEETAVELHTVGYKDEKTEEYVLVLFRMEDGQRMGSAKFKIRMDREEATALLWGLKNRLRENNEDNE